MCCDVTNIYFIWKWTRKYRMSIQLFPAKKVQSFFACSSQWQGWIFDIKCPSTTHFYSQLFWLVWKVFKLLSPRIFYLLQISLKSFLSTAAATYCFYSQTPKLADFWFSKDSSKNMSITINVRLSKLEFLSIRYLCRNVYNLPQKFHLKNWTGFDCNSDSYRKIKKTAFNRGNRENSKVKLHLPFVFTTDVFPIWRGYERWHHFQLLQKY